VKYFNRDIFGWLGFDTVLLNQVRFQQFRVIERFCVEGNN